MKHCAKCNKEMEEKGMLVAGIIVQLSCTIEDKKEFVQKQLGKYKIEKEYMFCYECWLDSLFGVSKENLWKTHTQISLRI